MLDRRGQKIKPNGGGSAICHLLVLRKAPTINDFSAGLLLLKQLPFPTTPITRYQSDISNVIHYRLLPKADSSPPTSNPSPMGKGVHNASRSFSVFCVSFSWLSSTAFPEDACDASALLDFGVSCRSGSWGSSWPPWRAGGVIC